VSAISRWGAAVRPPRFRNAAAAGSSAGRFKMLTVPRLRNAARSACAAGSSPAIDPSRLEAELVVEPMGGLVLLEHLERHLGDP
jgi:hypothetical protein